MPRYFFTVHDGRAIPDPDGTELPDIYAAQGQAIEMAGEILREMGAEFWRDTEWRMEVAGERGGVLFVLRFSAEELLPPLLPADGKPSPGPADDAGPS